MMTTTQIASAIQACINATGELVLPGTALGSASMQSAFAAYLPNAELILTTATVLPATETEVTVTGLGGTLFLTLTVTATFTPTTSGDIGVVIQGVMASGYCLSSAFPVFAASVYTQMPFAAGGTLVLTTLPPDATPAILTLDGGLLTTTGVLAGITTFLTGTTPISISGPIDTVLQTLDGITSQTPSFVFNAPGAQNLTVGTLTGDFTFNLSSTPYLANVYDTTTSQIVPTYTTASLPSLNTEITFSAGGGPMTVTAQMPFTVGPGASLAVGIAGAPGVSLDTFTDWAGGGILTDALPTLFDPSQFLTLDGISFSYLLSPVQLLSFTVSVSTTEQWVVIPDLITVGEVTFALTSSMMGSTVIVSGLLTGTVILGSTPPVTIELSAGYPSYAFSGTLEEGTSANLSSLVTYLIPAATGIPSIDLDSFDFSCMPSSTSTTYSIQALLSSDWQLDVGPVGMAVTEAWAYLTYGSASAGTSTTTGSVGGTIVFNSDITFTVTYAIPGVFSVGGTIPEINLSALIAVLVDIGMPLPAGFDLIFTNCLIAICYASGASTLSFQASADVSGLGTVSFEALEVSNQWGYAAGLSMGSVAISNVPGLSGLAPFVSFFSFQELILVVSTSALGTFIFPTVPAPSGSTGLPPATPVTMPANQGVMSGMYAYAQVNLTTQPELNLLMQVLNMTAMLSVTLQISMSNVGTDSSVSAAITGEMNSNLLVSGALGATMVGDVLSVSVSGTLSTILQGQTVIFTIMISLEPNGLLLSGDYVGTIDFCIVKISNLILEIGVDFEEIPTVGFGAQIDTTTFESSIMVLLDSIIPTQSMFIGSVSEMSLGTFLENLCGILEQQPPSSLMDTLNAVSITGTNPFTIADTSNSVEDALNSMDVPSVSAAFATAGITLSSSPTQVLITVATSSSLWFVTDLVNMLYYQLTKSGSGQPVNGIFDPQLYVVPQTTTLGTTIVQEGFRANAALNLFGFTASVTLEILEQQGFSISATFSPIVIAVSGYPVFSFISSASNPSVGPSLSVCTYSNPATNMSPHFDANGYIDVLGVFNVGVLMQFTETGGNFSMTANLSSVAFYTLSGAYSSLFNFSVSGTSAIGVDQTMNFGTLGNILFDATVNYSYGVQVTSATSGSGSASGGFSFEGLSFSIPSFTLPLNTTSLANIATDAASQVQAALQQFINDANNWMTWLGNNIITGITGGAEQVGSILGSYFTMGYDTIATQTTAILSYTTDEVTQALQGAGATADETYDVLVNTLGVTTSEATTAVDSFFTGADHFDVPHSDSTGAHVDTGHTDTNTDHVDDAHTDTVTDHVDSGHTDTNTDHVDSKMAHDDAHWDAWGSPQSHTDSASHDDTSLHTDLPHDDTALHTDLGHDDTSLHTDLPHDDTAAHFDTPHTDGPA